MRRIVALDGVRGLAVLSVVSYHATSLRLPEGGFFGVDLFFVLSGYLITSLLLAEHERNGTISLRAFYRRRARRLLPALILLLTAGLVAGLVGVAEGRIGAAYLARMAGASVYTTNFFAAFNQLGVAAHWIGGLWSLAAEEQFYLLWPLLLVWLLRHRDKETMRRFLLGAFALAITGFYTTAATASIYQLAYSPAARSIAIVGGCLLAISPISFRGGLALGWFLYGATILLCPLAQGAITIFTPFGIAGAMLLVSNAERSVGVLCSPLLRWFGSISYSLYLWHPALLWLLPGSRSVAVVLAIAIAAASTRWLEDPIRRGGIAGLRRGNLVPAEAAIH